MDESRDKVIILSQYFYPDVATTGQLLLDIATGLTGKGFVVQVISAFPTYDSRIRAERKEFINGISVHRIWSTKIDKNKYLGKVLNSLTFFFSSLVHSLLTERSTPFLIVSNPPFLPFIGYISKMMQRRRFIYLIHDVYPDIAIRLGYLSKNSLTSRFWSFLNIPVLKSASKIIVLSNSMKQVILNKIETAKRDDFETKIEVIHNWADKDYIKPVPREKNEFIIEHKLQDNFIVLYSGNLGLFHRLETVVEAAKKILNSNVKFIFIGEGGKKNKLRQMVAEYGLKNVLFYPYVTRKKLPFSLTASDLAIVSLEKNIEGLAMPSKLYTLLAAGVPIVAFCDSHSDIASIIRDAQCGYSIDQDDSDRFIQIIETLNGDQKLKTQLGENGRKYFELQFTLQHAIEKYYSVIRNI